MTRDDVKTPYYYDNASHRWRETSSGRFLSQQKVTKLRDDFIDAQKDAVRQAARSMLDGTPVQTFERQMRQQIKDTFIAEYMLARGGKNAMTPSDYGRLGSMLRKQYEYLHTFCEDIQTGRLSINGIAARAAMYMDSATQAFERGKAAARDLTLPAYPGDGSTACKANCKCYWDIQETRTEWHCYWRRTAAESCPTCSDRTAMWSPLVIQKDVLRSLRLLRRALRVLETHP